MSQDEIAEVLYNLYHDAMENSAKKLGANHNWKRIPWKDLVQHHPHMADGWRRIADEYARGASRI